MPIPAGNFFPPEYKTFPFNEGDLLVGQRGDGKFGIKRILKVDRIEFRRGASINIQNQQFYVDEDDFLLIVSAAVGASEFSSFADASVAANAGLWTIRLRHVPSRTPGAAQGQVLVGHAAVSDAELDGYTEWRNAFDRGSAGVF